MSLALDSGCSSSWSYFDPAALTCQVYASGHCVSEIAQAGYELAIATDGGAFWVYAAGSISIFHNERAHPWRVATIRTICCHEGNVRVTHRRPPRQAPKVKAGDICVPRAAIRHCACARVSVVGVSNWQSRQVVKIEGLDISIGVCWIERTAMTTCKKLTEFRPVFKKQICFNQKLFASTVSTTTFDRAWLRGAKVKISSMMCDHSWIA